MIPLLKLRKKKLEPKKLNVMGMQEKKLKKTKQKKTKTTRSFSIIYSSFFVYNCCSCRTDLLLKLEAITTYPFLF